MPPSRSGVLFIFGCLSVGLLLTSACGPSVRKHTTVVSLVGQEPLRSTKGWELYSWQEEGEWVFAVLMGTNRLKNAQEIKAAKLSSLEALHRTLAQLARGQSVLWITPDAVKRTQQSGLQFLEQPPKDVIAQVKAFCEAQRLSLRILSQ